MVQELFVQEMFVGFVVEPHWLLLQKLLAQLPFGNSSPQPLFKPPLTKDEISSVSLTIPGLPAC
jgi:hypothetical protein